MDEKTKHLATLAEQLGAALQTRQWVLSTAESCTGGWIAQSVTAIAGSSGWFDTGFVTYSNHAKQQLLGVRRETLEAHGAVSEEVVLQMAQGAVEHSLAQVSVAVSGIAGPSGGSEAKPVGTVYLAWASADGVYAQRHLFAGDRTAVRYQTVEVALNELLRLSKVGN